MDTGLTGVGADRISDWTGSWWVALGGARPEVVSRIEALFRDAGAPGTNADGAVLFDRGLWQAFIAEPLLAGLRLPQACGGSAGSFAEFAALFHAAGAVGARLPLFGHLAVAAQAIDAGGTASQRAKWLPAMVRGEIIASDGYCPGLRSENGRLSGVAPAVPHGMDADLLIVSNNDTTWLVETASALVERQAAGSTDPSHPLATATFHNAPAEPLADHAAASRALHTAGYLALAAEAAGAASTIAAARHASATADRDDDGAAAAIEAQLAVLVAADLAEHGSRLAPLALHHAKAKASRAYQWLARNLGADGGRQHGDSARHRARAEGFDAIMGPSRWHHAEIAKSLSG